MKKISICLFIVLVNSCGIAPDEYRYISEEDRYINISEGENCSQGECLIPGIDVAHGNSEFTMGRLGNCFEYDEEHRCRWYGEHDEIPAHEVYLSPFYIDHCF